MVTTCEKHKELLAQAQSILKKIYETMVRQARMLAGEGVSNRFLHYDKELELLMGEKERAVGALREHDREHKCNGDFMPRDPGDAAADNLGEKK